MANDKKDQATENKPGIFKRAGGKAASILGFTDIKRGLEKQVETIAESGERAKQLANGYREKLNENKNARTETFEQAVSRMNLTKKDLAQRRKELSIASYAYMGLLGLTLYFFILGLLNGHWIATFTTFTFLLTEGALIFQTRFRIWQIDSRKLGSPKEFISAIKGNA
jgi:hypothetical protein